MKKQKPSRLRNALAGAWIAGGILLAIGVASPFTWIDVAAGILLGTAMLGSAAASRMALVGLLFVGLGFPTILILVGVLLIPFGVALYALGLARAHFADPAVLLFAVGLLAAAVALASLDFNQTLCLELVAAAAVAQGVAIRIS